MKFNTLKSSLVVMIGMVVIAASAFAMAPKPTQGTWNYYLQEPYNACLAFGNPWAPNHRYKVDPVKTYNADGTLNYVKDANGAKIALPLCSTVQKVSYKDPVTGNTKLVPVEPCFDETKPEYDQAKWNACAKPYYDYANTCFAWNGKTRVKIACALTDPTGFYKN